jgi:hypothetical protein
VNEARHPDWVPRFFLHCYFSRNIKMLIIVMPAWIAGIQVRKDVSRKTSMLPGFQHSMRE